MDREAAMDEANAAACPSRTSRPARRARLAALIGVNAALLGLLALVGLSPRAGAQAAAERSRGMYSLLGGELPFGNANAIYVLDASNEEMLALRWNPSRGTGELEVLGYRNIRLDMSAQPQR
jgi:hypothetical protein